MTSSSTALSAAVKTIAIGADHGGFSAKERLKAFLERRGYRIIDSGTHDESPVDYPVIAGEVARRVAEGSAQRGIAIDGAGIGSCMAANKIPGIRAAMCYDVRTAVNSREHNNANVLTLGGKLLPAEEIEAIVDVWLRTDCTESRHLRRADQILEFENRTLQSTGKRTNFQATSMKVNNISDKELEQLAEQIAGLLQGGGFGIPGVACDCTCCGSHCGGHCAEKAEGAVRELIGIGAGRITYRPGGRGVAADIAAYIDHTLLKPEAGRVEIEALCEDARRYDFASVCINPSYVRLAAKLLKGSAVKVCTVVGFPLGAHMPQIKALEARQAIREGAREIDMVINIGALKSGDGDLLYRDIRAVVDACQDGGALSKVIIETALLTDEEKIIACETARRARADFVKTSTGFAGGGATAHDVALMARIVHKSGMGVKASGGVRTYKDALTMLKAGATRIGASASVQIVRGQTPVTASGY